MHVDSEIVPSTRGPFPWWALTKAILALLVVIGVTDLLYRDYNHRRVSDPQFEQKVNKLVEREKALTGSVKRLTERRDAVRQELIVMTAGLAATKSALNVEVPVSNVITQVVILELHLNR
jgi:hypothetical protein